MGDVIEILTTATNTVEVEAQGPQGIPGVGVPTGGSALQILRKKTGTDYDTEWAAAGAGSGSVTSVALASSDLTISGSPITDSGTITANIAVNAVTLEKLQPISSEHFLGRHGAGTGDVQPVSAEQARTILNVADGAEVNVNADWNASSGDAQILNKPTLGGAAALNVGTTTGTVAAGDDARLSDSRNPTAHSASHATGGSDPLAPSDIGAADTSHTHVSADITDATDSATANTIVRRDATQGAKFGGSLDAVDIYASGIVDGYQLNENGFALASKYAGISHTHGNITNDGKVGVTAGLPLKTGTAGAVEAGAFGVNAGEFAEGNHTHTQLHDRSHAITSTSDHTAGNHKVFYSDGSGQIQELALGNSGEVLTSNGATSAPSFAAASGGIGGSTGATDGAILRADGTGGSTSQSSDLVIDDAVVSYAITGDASTDIITAVGHPYTDNQAVRFQVLAGGSGLNNTTTYFVRDISGDTFKVSATSGGAAVNFTTNITGGSVVAIQPHLKFSLKQTVFSITANASTDVITATGHTFKDGDRVSFLSLTGGSGLNTSTVFFVRDAATDTFKVSSTAGGTATNITVDYTGGVVELFNLLWIYPAGRGACFIGENIANSSGIRSFVGGGDNNSASGVNSATIGGQNNTASGARSSVLAGSSNTASGTSSVVVGGENNTNSAGGGGEPAFIGGGSNNTASAAYAAVMCGHYSLADRYGIQAHAAGRFQSLAGEAQSIRAVLRCTTTTNSAVELALNGTTSYLTIPTNKIIFCNIKIVGTKTDGSAVATYERQYCAKNVAGTSSEVYAPVLIGADNAAGTSISITTQDAGDYISMQVTGVASENWRWVASVDGVEVRYAT